MKEDVLGATGAMPLGLRGSCDSISDDFISQFSVEFDAGNKTETNLLISSLAFRRGLCLINIVYPI